MYSCVCKKRAIVVVSVKDIGCVSVKIVALHCLIFRVYLGVNSVFIVFLTLVLLCSITATVYAISQDDGSDSKEIPRKQK